MRAALVFCLLGSLASGLATVCVGQAYTPPPPKLTSLPPCPVEPTDKDAAKKKKKDKAKDCDPTNVPSPATAAPSATPATLAPDSAAAKFPYPGGVSGGESGDTSAKPADAPAAKKFPYPGDAPAAPAPAAAKSSDVPAGQRFPYPGSDNGEKISDDGKGVSGTIPPASEKAGQTPETSAAKKFPFPGCSSGSESSPTGIPETPGSASSSTPVPSPDSPSSSSSSSSSADDAPVTADDASPKPSTDDAQPKLKDKGSSGRRVLKVLKPQSDTDRVDEDLSVAKFYSQSGNNMAAYLRAKDAVKTQPEYPEAHFVLGEAARKLNKRDEAKAELQEYLKLAPDGERAKAAEKALEQLP